jgi:hypothetical protein
MKMSSSRLARLVRVLRGRAGMYAVGVVAGLAGCFVHGPWAMRGGPWRALVGGAGQAEPASAQGTARRSARARIMPRSQHPSF